MQNTPLSIIIERKGTAVLLVVRVNLTNDSSIECFF